MARASGLGPEGREFKSLYTDHKGVNMERDKILLMIAAERQYQDKKYGGIEHDRTHSANDWIAYISLHAGKGVDGGEDFKEAMVRVAALAIAALEAY